MVTGLSIAMNYSIQPIGPDHGQTRSPLNISISILDILGHIVGCP